MAQSNRRPFHREPVCLRSLKMVAFSPHTENNRERFSVDKVDLSVTRLHLPGDCVLKFPVLESFERRCHSGHVLPVEDSGRVAVPCVDTAKSGMFTVNCSFQLGVNTIPGAGLPGRADGLLSSIHWSPDD